MSRVARWIWLSALLFAAPCWAQTADTGADPALAQKPDPALEKMVPADVAKQPFVVGVALGSPPDEFRNEKGETVGWEVDIIHGVAQLLGLELELHPISFDTLIPGLQAKRFEAAIGQLGITVVREKVIDMVGTLASQELFAALTDDPIKVNSLDDLCGLTVATTRGSREMAFVAQQQPKCEAAGKKPINALAFNDGNAAAEALMSKRAELYWLGSTAISYFVGKSDGRTKVVGHYTDLGYIGIGLPKDSPMVKPIQAAVQALIDNGTYGKILDKWGLQKGAITTSPINPTNSPM